MTDMNERTDEVRLPPSKISGGLDTWTIAKHMKDFRAFVAEAAPKLHWKIYQDLGADPSRHNGYYDGWQIGFGEAVFGPLPLSQLIDEMKASVTAKVRSLANAAGSDDAADGT